MIYSSFLCLALFTSHEWNLELFVVGVEDGKAISSGRATRMNYYWKWRKTRLNDSHEEEMQLITQRNLSSYTVDSKQDALLFCPLFLLFFLLYGDTQLSRSDMARVATYTFKVLS